jgi:hypothetical protein
LPDHIYFNEFQHEITNNCKNIKIEHGKFKLNGVRYVISEDDNTIQIDKTSPHISHELNGELSSTNWFSQEIVDDMFAIDGIHYRLNKGSGGTYVGISYASADDNHLTKLNVSTTGDARYDEWLTSFIFSEDGNHVHVIRDFSTKVMDRVIDEWCAYDDVVLDSESIKLKNGDTSIESFTSNITFEWHLVKEILRLKEQKSEIMRLGDGQLFNGFLDGCTCTVSVLNELTNGYVVTNAILKIKENGTDETKT